MINLLFAGNNKVFDGMLITLLSLTKHTKTPVNAFCLTMDLQDVNPKFIAISKKRADFLEKILKEGNSESKLTLIDLSDMFRNEMLDSVNLKSHFTPYTLLRLFADKIEQIPDKILYLDTDTIINNDINELYNIDIENYEIACVNDIYNWTAPSRWRIKNYFNAGVMLLNMKKIRETGMFAKTRELCRYKKMLYPDQDALNKTVTYKKMLPVKFNSKDKYYPEIVVHHFCNVRKNWNFFHRIKPWEVDLVKTKMSAYNDILDKYLEKKKEFESLK